MSGPRRPSAGGFREFLNKSNALALPIYATGQASAVG
jgi:hypothetical protein